MSDLCMYEFEDNVWDEFGENDDHRVPHPSDGDGDKRAVQGDSHNKKGRHEVVDMSASANAATKHVIHGNEETMIKKDTTVIDSRMAGHYPKGDNIGSVGSEFCANDLILDDSNNNSYDYPISHISQADNGFFYDNDGEDKESSDLFYGLPDVGNFEDVDRMFRSCDSTFGMGSLHNDDDMCWFSEGPEEALKSGFKFSCPESNQSGVLENVSEHSAPSAQNYMSPSIDDADRKSVYLSDKVSNQTTDAGDHDVSGCTQFLNEFDAKSENSSQPVHKGQRKQSKHHNRPDRKRKDCYSENAGSLKQFGIVEHPSVASSKSNQVFTPVDTRQHKQNIKPSPSISHTQTQAPYMHMDFSNPSDHMSVPSLPGTKPENNRHPSPSPNESSHSSTLVQSTENEMKKKFHGRQDTQAPFSGNFTHAHVGSPNIDCNHVSGQKQTHQSENAIDDQNEVEGAGVPVKLDSSDVQESTCISSVLEEVSPQATSFRQLQQVTEQLDIRSKLCIRDSLYRLARSAEQRHNCLNPSGGSTNDRDVNGALVADETNKRTGYIDIETNTNPVDRSIAHLLFHRPRDPSVMPANDASSFKSHSKVQGSLPNPLSSEKQTFQEIAPGTDNKLLRDGEK